MHQSMTLFFYTASTLPRDALTCDNKMCERVMETMNTVYLNH